MKVKFKKLHPDAKIPQYAKPGDAAMDLIAISSNLGHANSDFWEMGTGLSVEIPLGHVGLIFPRSSISNKDVTLSNSVGVIDSGYRGEIKFRFRVTAEFVAKFLEQEVYTKEAKKLKMYKPGDKIGQLMIIPIPTIEPEEVEELSDTERGTGGFGSSGS